jgi:hypothetical protein
MAMAESAQLTDAVVTQRARLRTLKQRRRRLWRRIATLAIVSVVMILVVMLNRDTQHLHKLNERGQMVAAALQHEFESRGVLPLMFPSGRNSQERDLQRQLEALNRENGAATQDADTLRRKRQEVERALDQCRQARHLLERERPNHYFNMLYVRQQDLHPGQGAGVCCFEKPVRFFMRTAGRIVILFDGQEFHSRWMPEDEFRAKADQLGFGDLLMK